MATTSGTETPRSNLRGTVMLCLGATGVVFGDIGTSPLYAFKESLQTGGTAVEDIFGIASLIFWTLVIVVTVKYLAVVMRADNHGEGGILSLLALLPARVRAGARGGDRVLLLLILAGTALLFGDGVLTPAISVLSATEGLALVNPALGAYAVQIAVVILVGLFAAQSRGTHRIGLVFGPVMVVWFLVLGGLGAWRMAGDPSVLAALSPTYAVEYIVRHGWQTLVLSSSVILAVTGAEALYADMGHFGRRPIRLAWGFLVGPALVLCYLGQAALVINEPEAAANPFFALAPSGTTLALVVLATVATVVASQALITGVFSLARQAIQLGLLPRLGIEHTHREHEGQIYVPLVNVIVGVLCIALVLTFRTSSSLAHAYVLAIAGTMLVTTIAFHAVASMVWHWSPWRLWPLTILFLVVDSAFLVGTLTNLFKGGWVPVLLGAVVLGVMLIWRTGSRALAAYLASHAVAWTSLADSVRDGSVRRIPGFGIYLASRTEDVPSALSSQARAMRVMPEEVLVVTVVTEDSPVALSPVETTDIMPGVRRARVPVGYMESADIPRALRSSVIGEAERGATYYVSERQFVATDENRLPAWLERVFGYLHRNAQHPSQYFSLPLDRVITIGTRIDL